MKTAIAAIFTIIFAGCAMQPYRPVRIDPHSSGNYEQDLSICRQLAASRHNKVQNAAGGAVVGGILGAIIGRSIGGYGNELAGWGAAAGGVQSAAGTARAQKRLVLKCMTAKGWSVAD